MKHSLVLIIAIATVVMLTACGAAGPAPAPTTAAQPTRTAAPALPAATATTAPANTAVPPTDTPAPTNTVAGPTVAVTTTVAAGASPTATRPAVVATTGPTATAQPTKVTLKYGAPELVEPRSGDTRIAGKDTFRFRWKPVAELSSGEAYQVFVAIVNPIDNTTPSQNWNVGCNADSTGVCLFVLSNKPTGQDYLGLLAAANRLSSPNTLKVRWSVTVVLDQGGGKFVPISPTSDTIEFTLQNP